jgi:hypothetical protein
LKIRPQQSVRRTAPVSASASALKEGQHVQLTYTPGGTPVLQSVHITPAKTEKHGANKHSPARSNGA